MLKEKTGFLKSKQKGFTLIEVLAALGIISTVMILLMGLRNNNIKINDLAKNITQATLLARERLARISGTTEPGVKTGDFEGTPFSWEEDVSYHPILAKVREAKVSVMWKPYEGSPSEKRVEFTTYLVND